MDSDEPNISDKVDIISTEDDRLKVIGEILSSDSSRKILQLLFNQSFTANQLAQKTELSLPLVIHHLKKMQSVGVVKITNVGKNSKSHDMKFYIVDKVALVILPNAMSQPAKKSKSLFNSFNRIHRLATLGGVSVAAWFTSQFMQKTSTVSSPSQPAPSSAPFMSRSADSEMTARVPAGNMESSGADSAVMTGDVAVDVFLSVIVVLAIVVIGLGIEVALKSRKNR
ncbi:ArsR/SmtB family transcription factor [Nitrosopumilus maritimus]|uniref:Transcriptional regulator, ArsR family n=1 Tax=Nitrosopumilus maritimus (strain SCM1) TaxID=436308 RepID=A9A2L6_NITMS|nr:winged helix-turn-helix domain-containing protein [Nitrosopumilus maritimus]ABX13255.1 transcriptional regulator, ArsR family [Nitrosopumilus maritimus SCM1]